MNVAEVAARLKDGNRKYLTSVDRIGDISAEARRGTAENGQRPFAIVVACSDSREIPEAIFSCGIGELFTVRVAGNVTDDSILGSIEYAAGHLHCPLVLVLGHTHCGAVSAAISGGADGYIASITGKISRALMGETDDRKASVLNINATAGAIRAAFAEHHELSGIRVAGALYDIETGEVEFLEEIS